MHYPSDVLHELRGGRAAAERLARQGKAQCLTERDLNACLVRINRAFDAVLGPKETPRPTFNVIDGGRS